MKSIRLDLTKKPRQVITERSKDDQVADWPYSSFHRLVRSGVYPPDWERRWWSGNWTWSETANRGRRVTLR